MNEEVKALWLYELRSGYYRQGIGRMKSTPPTRFCPLGVLCNLYGRVEDVRGWRAASIQNDRFSFDDGSSVEEHSYLPPNVQQWAELPYSPFWRDPTGQAIHLSQFNDNNHDGRYTLVIEAIRLYL